MHCPECGFELEPGDEFCINCGAAIETDPKPKTRKRKAKFHPLPLIIVLAVLALAAGAVVFALNRPMVLVARGIVGTLAQYGDNETLKTLVKAPNGGSVEVSAELSDFIEDFNIPMLSEIEARAGLKLYMNGREQKFCTDLTGSLGGSNALGATLWTGPEEAAIKSQTLIGRDAYGVLYDSDSSLEKLEGLAKDNLGVDISEYNDYIHMYQAYVKKRDEIDIPLAIKSYCYMFKYGSIGTATEYKDINGDKEKTKTITVNLDKDSFTAYCGALYDWAEKQEACEEVLSYFDRDRMDELLDKLPDDYEVEYEYKLGKNSSGTDKVLLSQAQRYPDFSTRIDFDREITASVNDSVSFCWDSENGDFSCDMDGESIAKGSILSSDEGEVEVIIDDVPVDITILAEDEMPQVPDYVRIRTQDDIDDLVNKVTENVMGMVMQFMPQPQIAPEIPEIETEPFIEETEPETETETETEMESETGSEEESESESESESETETEAETVAPPEKPISGTYYYDDGNTFSIDFSTGQYQEHVTVKAVINNDGTYALVYSNGFFQYEDTGTYTCDKQNHMTFTSNSGIDATGEYHDKYIDVTIPGYITGRLNKVK